MHQRKTRVCRQYTKSFTSTLRLYSSKTSRFLSMIPRVLRCFCAQTPFCVHFVCSLLFRRGIVIYPTEFALSSVGYYNCYNKCCKNNSNNYLTYPSRSKEERKELLKHVAEDNLAEVIFTFRQIRAHAVANIFDYCIRSINIADAQRVPRYVPHGTILRNVVQ